MKKQQGFTLIELIIVIVILGILAVTVAPRFFNFAKDARISTLGGLKAGIQGAAQIEYARLAVAGSTPLYPGANAIADAAQAEATDWDIAVDGNIAHFSPKGLNDNFAAGDLTTITKCYVKYHVTNDTTSDPVVVEFKVTVESDGC